MERDGDPGRLTESGLTHLGQQVCWVWQGLPVPVIAAMRGHALGGGLQIAFGADIRIAHPDTQLSVRELHWGITLHDAHVRPVEAGAARCPRELTYTARVFDAREGYALGFVTHLPTRRTRRRWSSRGRSPAATRTRVRGAKGLFERLFAIGVADQFAQERLVGRC